MEHRDGKHLGPKLGEFHVLGAFISWREVLSKYRDINYTLRQT